MPCAFSDNPAMITNQEKKRVWDAYHARKPIRVPVSFSVNSRVIILDPAFNAEGISYRDYYSDARVAVKIQLKFMDYGPNFLSRVSDVPAGRPKEFHFYVDFQNTYDAAYFGCPVHFRDGQVPDITPILTGSDKNKLWDFDVDHPLDNPFIQQCFARYEAISAEAAKVSVPGVKFGMNDVLMGFDGPMTIAVQLRGVDFLTDMIEDPPYAVRLMTFIDRAVEIRNRALARRIGIEAFTSPSGGLADDSIQMISVQMYREMILPIHRRWYALSGPGPHTMHLCGDATRHFPMIHEEMNVRSFGTGFPVDHGALRKAVGPDVEIDGGPHVGLLLGGTSEQVYRCTKEILTSGIMEGGRFILKEANNLPPCCPEANLAAMYQACLDHGNYRYR
jgi:uroporphyrinogen-III decarboxylase